MAERNGNGMPPGSAEKSLGEIVSDITAKVSLLVREEIELAKTEVSYKLRSITRGAVAGIVAGVFAFFALIFILHGLAWGFVAIGTPIWLGYLLVAGILVLLGAVAALLAFRFLKSGVPPTPQLAIEEARKTREAIEEARA